MSSDEPSLRRYWDTVRHLAPEQILFQVWRPLQPWLWPQPKRLPETVQTQAGWGWQVPRPVLRRDPAVLEGVFSYWNTERTLDLEREWEAPDLGSSWNFPVHYFDEVAGMAADPDSTPERRAALRDFMAQWIEQHVVQRGDPWHPYTTSLRVVNWIDALPYLTADADEEWTRAVLHSLYRQALSIPPQLERHLLGTHLLKNLKAVLIASTVFDHEALHKARNHCLGLLRRELGDQVRADGGHMEPSAMYHCMATGDVLDLLNCRGALPEGWQGPTREVAARMLDYAAALMTPDGGYPLLGDAWCGGEWTPRQLLDYGARLGLDVAAPPDNLHFLEASGVAVARGARTWLCADVAPVGPPHLPSHGHCDSLSFEWWADGQPFIVDAGTFSYEDGTWRHECRSTSFHNTLQVDDQELHEIWSRFRVARRSAVTAERLDAQRIEARLVPWFDPALRLRRRFVWERDALRIEDAVEGSGPHRVVSRLHLHPEVGVRQEGDGVVTLQRGATRVRLQWQGGELDVLPSDTSGSRMAEEAGKMIPNPVVQMRYDGALPWESTLQIHVT